jgi:transcriptional regulator with XRE-family HTH domain
MASSAARLTLGQALRQARERRGWTLEKTAKAVGLPARQRLSEIESGERDPSLDTLVRLHAALYDPADGDRAASLLDWIVRWNEAQARRSKAGLSRAGADDLAQSLELLVELVPEHRRPTRRGVLSLEGFPSAFAPFKIICGDRRETDEDLLSRADLFIYSVAISDVTFLPRLMVRKGSTILSDKLCVVMDEASREREFGRSNLLIIGSTGVNWAARIVNRLSLWRFDIPRGWQQWDERYRSRAELDDEKTMRYFARIVRAAGREPSIDHQTLAARVRWNSGEKTNFDDAVKVFQELLGRGASRPISENFVMNQFRRGGIADPADGLIHAVQAPSNTDFAFISLAPNPFSKANEHVAIIVAGIHGLGTAHALRLLVTEPQFFAKHPFGGVLKIQMGRPYGDWSPTRFLGGEPLWETSDYEPEHVQHQFEGASEEDWRTAYRPEELDACRRLISRLMPTPGA